MSLTGEHSVMLISSDRHTAKDLLLWSELESADHAHAASRGHASRNNEARDAIISFVAQGPCYAGTSWGKDSVVVAYLLWRYAPDVPLMHLRPTNHNPDCDAVRDAYFDRYPGQKYVEVSVDYSGVDRTQPDSVVDRETDRCWYKAIREFGDAYGHRHILGLRGEESAGRRLRMAKWGLNSPNGCAPIGNWSTADVFAALASRLLPVHPAYAMLGSGRWQRDRLRVAELGDTHGKGSGRREWEAEYYGDVLRRLER